MAHRALAHPEIFLPWCTDQEITLDHICLLAHFRSKRCPPPQKKNFCVHLCDWSLRYLALQGHLRLTHHKVYSCHMHTGHTMKGQCRGKLIHFRPASYKRPVEFHRNKQRQVVFSHNNYVSHTYLPRLCFTYMLIRTTTAA